MATSEIPTRREPTAATNTPEREQPRHRIRAVRLEQGVTLRTAARRMGIEMRQARRQEQESADLTLSQLYAWGRALRTPIEDLLVEPNTDLSRPIMQRAQLLRLMKTAASIEDHAPSPAVRRLAATLVEQLTEMMPELEHVAPWHSVGRRRGLNDVGRAADRIY